MPAKKRANKGPVTDGEHAKIKTLLEQDDPPLSLNAVAKAAGRSVGTIKKIADTLGVDRSTPSTAAANETRRQLAAARRASLELDFLDDVALARTVFAQAMAAGEARDAKDAMWAAGHAFDKSQKIADSARDVENHARASSMLGDLAAAITGAFENDDTEDPA